MFQSNSFAATLALCFSSVSATAFATDSVQLDVYHGGHDLARRINDRWKMLDSNNQYDEDVVKLQATLVPIDEADDRIILVWSGIQRNLPPSKSLGMFHDDIIPSYSLALSPTEYSPSNWELVRPGEIFELRTYVLSDGNLEAIHDRFRDHTIKLFERHKMRNVEYYQLFDDENVTLGELLKSLAPLGQDFSGASPSQSAQELALVYFLAHRSKEAAAASFAAFRSDPEWISARNASEEKAGGSLTVTNGVKSLLLKKVM